MDAGVARVYPTLNQADLVRQAAYLGMIAMIRTDYDKIAHLYDEDEVRTKNVDSHLVEYLAQYKERTPEVVKILDIACGTGNQLIANKAKFPQIEMCGMDKFEKMLEQARRKSRDITWIQADMDQDGLNIGTFDYISCQFAYHHSRNKRQFLKNAYRNLGKDGWFTIINLDVFGMEDWYVYRFFPAAKAIDWQDFLRAEVLVEMAQSIGFEIVNRKTQDFKEQIVIQDIYRTCSKRHTCSELITIPDSDYEAGVSEIRGRMLQDRNAVIESPAAILDVVFKKP